MEVNEATGKMLGKLGTEPEKFLEKITLRLVQAKVGLARELDKPKPDAEKVGRFEQEVKLWEQAIGQHHEFAKLYGNPESALKEELEAFGRLLDAKGRVSESEVKEQIKFKDNVWRAIFFGLLEKRKDVRKSRKLVLFGERSYEKARK